MLHEVLGHGRQITLGVGKRDRRYKETEWCLDRRNRTTSTWPRTRCPSLASPLPPLPSPSPHMSDIWCVYPSFGRATERDAAEVRDSGGPCSWRPRRSERRSTWTGGRERDESLRRKMAQADRRQIRWMKTVSSSSSGSVGIVVSDRKSWGGTSRGHRARGRTAVSCRRG